MKAKLALLSTIFAAVLVLAFAVGTMAAKPKGNPSREFSLPETARRVAPNVYYLGAVEHEGITAEGYAFVDKGKGYGKPTGCKDDGKCQGWEDASCSDCSGGGGDGGDGGGTDTSSCYGFLSNGAKWKDDENWVVNPSNTRGLGSNFVLTALSDAVSAWESAASYNILGDGSSTNDILVADTDAPDDRNEVYFADIGSDGAIGVTIVWGYFRGNPAWRELIEWDQVYDDVDFNWSEDCDTEDCTSEGNEKMDFPNIAIHELGHSVGLDDIYDDKCSPVTMFGYADYGETDKRSLEDGDINGVTKLYQ